MHYQGLRIKNLRIRKRLKRIFDVIKASSAYTYNPIQLSSANLINFSKGTLEIEAYIPSSLSATAFTLSEHIASYTKNRISIRHSGGGAYQFGISNSSGTESLISSSTMALSEGIHIFTLKWNQLTMKAFIDGVQVGSTVNNPNLGSDYGVITIGASYYDGTIGSVFNSQIKKILWSNIDRTDSDITIRGNPNLDRLIVDKDTVIASNDIYNKNIFTVNNYDTLRKTYPIAINPNHNEAWPNLKVSLDQTVLYCKYRTADTNNHYYDPTGKVVIRKSTNLGKTWDDEITVAKIGTNLDCRNGGLLIYDNNGIETILATFNTLDSGGTMITYSTKSTDDAKTWSTPVQVASGTGGRATNCNPIKANDGNIYFACYNNAGVIYLEKSTNNGDSWTESTIATNATLALNETTLIETKTNGSFTGGLLAIVRTNTSTFQKFTSTNYGVSWSAGSTESSMPHTIQSRCSLNRLNSNTIMASYTDSIYNIAISISQDEGATYTKTRIPQFNTGLTSTYPDSVLIGNTLLTAWCTNQFSPDTSDIYITQIPLSTVTDMSPYLYNGSALANYQNAISNLNSIINLNVIGTSITEGSSATDVFNTSFAGLLRSQIATKYGDVGDGFIPYYYPTTNPTRFWTWSGTWTKPYNGGGIYNGAAKGAPGASVTFSFRGTEFHILNYAPGGGDANCTFSVAVDGGTAQNFTTGISYADHKSITGLNDGNHTAVITNTHSTKNLYIEGCWGSKGTKGVRLNQIGYQGSTAQYHSVNTALPSEMTYWGPKLTIIDMLSNDFNLQTSLVDYKTYMQAIITEAKKTGDILLTTIGANTNSKTIPIESYINVLYQLANENNIALYDEFKHNKYTNLSDNTHPNQPRHTIIGNDLFSILGI